ncbi:MAG: hypothetical protein ACU0DW_11490 [Shimia sp.]
MFRLIGNLLFVAVAFYAGMLFERSGAEDTCRDQPDWGVYFQCVASEML